MVSIDTTALYCIANPNNTDSVLDVLGDIDGDRSGLRLVMAAKTNAASQLFSFVPNGDGHYCIRSFRNPQKVLFQYPFNSVSQIISLGPIHPLTYLPELFDFVLEECPGNTIRLAVASFSNLVLDRAVDLGDHEDRCIVTPRDTSRQSQIWRLVEVSHENAGRALALPSPKHRMSYRLVSADDYDVVLEVDNSAPATTLPVTYRQQTQETTQYFIKHVNPEDGSISFLSCANRTIALTAYRVGQRGTVVGMTFTGSDRQKWISEGSGGAYRYIIKANPSFVLDSTGPVATERSGCCIYDINDGGPTQYFLTDNINPAPVQCELEAGETVCQIRSTSNSQMTLCLQMGGTNLISGYPVCTARVGVASSQSFFPEYDAFFSLRLRCAANNALMLTATGEDRENLVVAKEKEEGGLQSWFISYKDKQVRQMFSGAYHLWINGVEGMTILDAGGDSVEEGLPCVLRSSADSRTNNNNEIYDSPWKRQAWVFEETDVLKTREGKIFYFANHANSQYTLTMRLDAADGNGERNAYVDVRGAAISNEEKFMFRGNPDGTYCILWQQDPSIALTAVSLSNRGAVKGKAIDFNQELDKKQCWRLLTLADGTYRLVSASNSAFTLDLNGTPPPAGSNCIMWAVDTYEAQKWDIVSLSTDDGIDYTDIPWFDDYIEDGPGSGEGGSGGSGEGGEGGSSGSGGGGEGSGEGEGGEPAGDTLYWNEKKLVYRIRNAGATTLAVTLNAPSPVSGTAATVETVTNAANQLFEVQPHDDGSCTLAVCANRALALTAAGTVGAGSSVQGATDTGADSQRWRLVRQHDGTFAIACRQDHYAWLLDTRDAGLTVGTSCTVHRADGASSQRWTLEPVVVGTDGAFIQNGLTTVRLRNLSGAEAPVYAQVSSAEHAELGVLARVNHLGFGAFSHNAAQIFNLEPSVGGTYIESAQDLEEGQLSPLALTADSLIQRAPVHALTEGGANNQLWNLELQGDGAYLIRLIHNNPWYLDSTGYTASAASFGMVWPTIGPDATSRWLPEPAFESETPESGEWPDPIGTPVALCRIRNFKSPSLALERGTSSPCIRYVRDDEAQLFVKHIISTNSNNEETVAFLDGADPTLALTASLNVSPKVATMAAWDPENIPNTQKWNVLKQTDGSFRIQSCDNTSYYLDTSGSSTTTSSNCIMYGYDANSNTQRWLVEDVDFWENGAPAAQYPEGCRPAWRLRGATSTSYAISMRDSAESFQLKVATVGLQASQLFWANKADDGAYTFDSCAYPGKLISAADLNSDTRMYGVEESSTQKQLWYPEVVSDQTFRLLGIGTGNTPTTQMIDTTGQYISSSSVCLVWHPASPSNQNWTIEPAITKETGSPDLPSGTEVCRIVSQDNTGMAVRLNSEFPVAGTPASTGFLGIDPSEIFIKVPLGNDVFALKSFVNPNVCLSASALGSFKKIVAAEFDGTDSLQKWISIQNNRISLAEEDWVLDINGSTPRHGSYLVTWPEGSFFNSQKWTIETLDTVAVAASPSNQ